jgi:predicted house-cleaning noncanonical NTP pyrophosphatase (MazG superfamily)
MYNHYVFKIEKLVRDNIPKILEKDGVKIFHRIMDKDEYLKNLKLKLLEEAKEVLAAKSRDEILEELADLVEVIQNLQSSYLISNEDLENARLEKKTFKGGFQNKIYAAKIEIPRGHELAGYYLARSEDYPQDKS